MKTCYYQKLDIYYEICQITETLLNDEVRMIFIMATLDFTSSDNQILLTSIC